MSKILQNIIAASVLMGAMSLGTGCDDTASTESRHFVNVNSEDLEALHEGEFYVLNSGDEVTYHLDPSSGSLDLSKVILRGEDGAHVSLKDALVGAPEFAGVDPDSLGEAAITVSHTEEGDGTITPRKAEAAAGCVGVYILGVFIIVCW